MWRRFRGFLVSTPTVLQFASHLGGDRVVTVDLKQNRNLISGFRIRIHFFRIWIQCLRLETNPDQDPIRIKGFNDQKLKKLQLKKIF
jgi:hypothetical protein